MSSAANQAKYFLVEENQSFLSAGETCVELGFALHNVDLPISKQKSQQVLGQRIRSLFRTNSSSHVHRHHRASDAASDGGLSIGSTSTATRSSKFVIPVCMLQVYCKDEQPVASADLSATPEQHSPKHPTIASLGNNEKPATTNNASSPLSQGWHLVYQSDPKKISHTEPITLNALLLLPLPTIIQSNFANKMDRPIRFEVWAGQRKTDTLVGCFEGMLGQILQGLGAPKRFPHSPSMTSYWDEIDLGNVEGVYSKAKLAVRVGFPDRLISVSVPNSVEEVDVSEWRPAPFFAGPTLRGLTFNPVSKAFQASVVLQASDASGENAGLMSETVQKKMTKRGMPGTNVNLMEFREEMAEMPLNLLIPACFLDLACLELAERCDSYTQKFHRDLGLIRKLATSDFALTVNDFSTPKYLEAVQKLEKFALDLVAQGRERIVEMKEASSFYMNQWTIVVGAKATAAGMTKKKKTTLRLLQGDLLDKSSSVDRFAEEEEEEVDDDEVEKQLRKAYVEELKHDNLMDEEAVAEDVATSCCSFRKSTSRKDRRLRFMPINMHLQVLTVRETMVHSKPAQKQSAMLAQGASSHNLRNRLKSFATRRLTLQGISSMDPAASPTPLNGSKRSLLMRKGGLLSSTQAMQQDGEEDEDNVALREETFFYDTLSAGAPAAHALTSKYGGCWQQLKEVTKVREDFKRMRDDPKYDIFARFDAYRKFKEMEWILGERVDVCLPQALAIMAGAILGRIYVMAAEFSSSVVGGFEAPDDEVARSLITHGFLIGWESLLSTHGKEMAMLGDLFYAVRYLNEHVVIRLEQSDSLDDNNSRNGFEDGSGEEDEDEGEKILLGESLNVRLFKTTLHKDQPSGYDAADRFLGPGGSDDGAVWLLVARIPSSVVEKLPKVVRSYIESSQSQSLFDHPPEGGKVELDQLTPAPLKWTCVLFTQGINEMQNVANLMGNNRALQEEINEFSCTKLVEYCVKRFEVSPEATKKTRRSVKMDASSTASSLTKEALMKEDERHRRAKVAYQQSLMWAAKLRISVSNQSQAGKSFEILQNSADLVRWLSGVRIASCKSAKDRTAMSLTWEEARILHNIHFVRDMPLLDLANLFREHGTRLVNVHKNTGVPRYAFNKAQRSFLPESYRPPMSTIGSLFGGNLS